MSTTGEPAIEGLPDAGALLTQISRINVFHRITWFDAVLDALDAAEASAGAAVALEHAHTAWRLFAHEPQSVRVVVARIRAYISEIDSPTLEVVATLPVLDSVVTELLGRSEFDRAHRLVDRLRQTAESEECWSLYATLSGDLARIEGAAHGFSAAVATLDAARAAVPASEIGTQLELMVATAQVALRAHEFEYVIDRIEAFGAEHPLQNRRLEDLLVEAHQCAGRDALRADDFERAQTHFMFLIDHAPRDVAVTSAMRWGSVLMARGDVTSLASRYQTVLRRVGASVAARRTLTARIGLAHVAFGDNERALSAFRTAYAKVTIFDELEPEPLNAYATLLAQRGETGLASWARERAASERTHALNVAPRGPGRG